ncbi:MAG: crossover junction endodeoxyribonuclease RuvC [bacterium]
MRVLGIDPGSRATGYGVIDSGPAQARVVASGAIKPPVNAEFSAKLLAVHDGISALIAEHAPHEVALEDAFLAKNVRTVALISQVRGVILLAAARAGVPVFEYAPRDVKMAIVGNGAAAKPQVEKMVTRLLGLTAANATATLDESDALAVALCHAHRERARTRVNA